MFFSQKQILNELTLWNFKLAIFNCPALGRLCLRGRRSLKLGVQTVEQTRQTGREMFDKRVTLKETL